MSFYLLGDTEPMCLLGGFHLKRNSWRFALEKDNGICYVQEQQQQKNSPGRIILAVVFCFILPMQLMSYFFQKQIQFMRLLAQQILLHGGSVGCNFTRVPYARSFQSNPGWLSWLPKGPMTQRSHHTFLNSSNSLLILWPALMT